MRLGVTVGKFNPYHQGHSYLIKQAKTQCDKLVVIIGDRGKETLSTQMRAQWIAEDHPDVEVHITKDDLPEAPLPWAKRTIEILGRAPDVAFTSEEYGKNWAAAMGCKHEIIDQPRNKIPISGTKLRDNLGVNWKWLTEPAKAALAKRVIIVGAESTGTTTLATALGEHYKTVWVPEYGRQWWEGRKFLTTDQWAAQEFSSIVDGQAYMEDRLARISNQLVIGDTDALVTMVFEERYKGSVSSYTQSVSEARVPDLYIVTGDDIPWDQDGTRESYRQRNQMQEKIISLAKSRKTTWIEVSGTHDERMTVACEKIDLLLKWPILL